MQIHISDGDARHLVRNFQIKENDKDFARLYKAFEPMLHSIVGKHQYDNDDLMSEANMRFFEGVKKFNPESNTKFSSYIYNHISLWLRNYIRRNAALFGKRSGCGDSNAVYHKDISPAMEDTIPSPTDSVNNDEKDVLNAIVDTAEKILEAKEFMVLKAFFGIREYDEPTFNEITGRREDDPKYVRGNWVNKDIPNSRKFKRIACDLHMDKKIVSKTFNSAINKLRKNEKIVELGTTYMEIKIQNEGEYNQEN